MSEPSSPLIPGGPERAAPPLRRRRCVRHSEREAAGRCRGCEGDFCRECLVEHEGRLLCAVCLERVVTAQARETSGLRLSWLPGLGRMLASVGSFLVLCLLFGLLGRLLLSVPANFHEDSLWKELKEVQE